ncbi:Conidiation protein 6-domain-containing protein [Podospora fimiseda]|uniref:Conidiation protein 6-domain-containing protein n=1 Tax=Podospora fimiseda TaxID=252190 RepID=A0AAN6YLM4_9PEZI|nr:Conidiation protein 6-domain-containing protein [Podospora fimiseda]
MFRNTSRLLATIMTNPLNRERGLRAAISNPRVSEEAKQRDREILATEFGDESAILDSENAPMSGRKKSYSTGPSSSTGSSSYAKKTRSASSGNPSFDVSDSLEMEGKDIGNVIRGLKAALSNPNVSKEAKIRDRQKLKDLGQ